MDEQRTNAPAPVLVFTLDERRYALPLPDVDQVVRAVDITPLPKAPDIVLGVINVHGEVIPAINARRRFGLPERAVDPSHQLIIARSATRALVLVVDSVSGVVDLDPGQVVDADSILRGLEFLSGVARLADGLFLITDLDRCLSLEEANTLDQAMQSAAQPSHLHRAGAQRKGRCDGS